MTNIAVSKRGLWLFRWPSIGIAACAADFHAYSGVDNQ
jgi:hypothetical protein